MQNMADSVPMHKSTPSFVSSSAAKEEGRDGSERWLRPLRLGFPQCPASFSGPREPHERNGKCVTRIRKTPAGAVAWSGKGKPVFPGKIMHR